MFYGVVANVLTFSFIQTLKIGARESLVC